MSFLMIRDKSEAIAKNFNSDDSLVTASQSQATKVRHDKKALRAESSSVINFYPKWCQCFACVMAKHYGKNDHVPFCERCQNAFRCPPQGTLSRFVYFICANCLFVGFMWGLDNNLALDCITPLIILELTGLSCGLILKMVGLPALLAPLLIGILLNNIPPLHFFKGLTKRHWIEPLREIALTIILTRAGIELSPKQLKKLQGIVPLAAFTPCIVEACTCGGLFYAFFYDSSQKGEMMGGKPIGVPIPIAMCFVAGFALGAVSPAVVVPGMLTLKKKNYGVREGIPTLLIAASSIDDVLAIAMFSVLLNFVEFKPNSTWKDYAGVLGVVAGLIHGIVVGIFLHFIPSKDMGRSVPHLRLVIILLFNLVCTFAYGIKPLRWLSGAGSVGVLTTSFIASFGWRSQPHWKYSMEKVTKALAHIWTLMVPMLFGTIGREIDLVSMDWNVVIKIIAIIFICLIVRCITMFLVCCCLPRTNCKERVFCALTWIPKATVQAALAPLVLSEFEDRGHLLVHARKVVILAVFAILITAPLGAILISLLGTRMLRKTVDFPEEFPDGEGMPDEVQELRSIKSPAATSQDFNAEVETEFITLVDGSTNSGLGPNNTSPGVSAKIEVLGNYSNNSTGMDSTPNKVPGSETLKK